VEGPRIIDVGIPGFGSKPALWRRSWRDKILPVLANFQPDIIFVCAGGSAAVVDSLLLFRAAQPTTRQQRCASLLTIGVALWHDWPALATC
jgi:acetoin utilization deacetylase AcuC-like enzyme